MNLQRLILILVIVWPAPGLTDTEPFVLEYIRVEGVQRIDESAVRSYLSFAPGDRVDASATARALRNLFETGFFQRVDFRREGNTLIVVLEERPWIEELVITGNDEVPTESFDKALKGYGLVKGRHLDTFALDRFERQLGQLYAGFGMYQATVDVTVTSTVGNTVSIAIEIDEGVRARIRQINIVGNKRFDEQELVNQFGLRPTGLLSGFSSNHLYSSDALEHDLEALRSFYGDRGYAAFEIVSTQVTTSPARDDVFVTITIVEGGIYKISQIELLGDLPVPKSELEQLITFAPRHLYSRQHVDQSAEFIVRRLGESGYAFANIDKKLAFDPDTRQVSIQFIVAAGVAIHVRRIDFENAYGIDDEVLRREMRQLEGTVLNPTVLELSRRRLEQLGYIRQVDIETRRIPETDDTVDLIVTITQQPARRWQIGGGFTDAQRVNLNGFFINENLFGSGQRLAISLAGSEFHSIANLSHTDHYLTLDGLSREISFDVLDIDQLTAASSPLDTQNLALSLAFDYRSSEFQTLRFGAALQDTQMNTSSLGSLQLQDWVINNGNSSMQPLNGDILLATDFLNLQLSAAWHYDTLNRPVFPDRGMRQQLRLITTVPGSEVEYYTVDYSMVKYWSVANNWTTRARVRLAFGDAFSGTTSIPPYLNWFAGGPDSVRGYRESRLGPRDTLGNPYGGNLLVNGQFELLMPVSEKWRNSIRTALFYDIGNTFSTGEVDFVDSAGQPLDYSFSFGQMKQSVGVSLEWFGPLGLLRLSYGVPIDDDEDHPNPFLRDEIDNFQVSYGFSF